MKHIIPVAACVALAAASCNSGSHSNLKTENDSLSYALGVLVGQNLEETELTDVNYELFMQGARDHHDSLEVMDLQSADTYLREYMERRQKAKDAEHEQDNLTFLEENKSKEGVRTTDTGLQYRILREGSGSQPDGNDSVRVHYTGKLIDGTVFDSSVQREEPVVFVLSNPMIPGFVEGMTMMKEGSKYELYIPSELGYGSRGGGRIKPGSTLIFEVELINVYSVK